MRRTWHIVVGILSLALVAQGITIAEELTDAKFRRLHKLLRPSADESWRTIPWKIELLDAQRIAAQQKKPIFIWAMDGHPLGCT